MTQQEMEYTGSCKELHGVRFDVRPVSEQEWVSKWGQYKFYEGHHHEFVMAQVIGTGRWHLMELEEFTPITGKPVF